MRERRKIPEGLDAALVRGAAASWGVLTDDLRVGTVPGPQEVIQLHERER